MSEKDEALPEWAVVLTSRLMLTSAAFGAAFIGQLCYLVIRYERLGFEKRAAQYLLKNHALWVLGLVLTASSTFLLAVGLDAAESEIRKRILVQVCLSGIPPVLISVSIYNILHEKNIKKVLESKEGWSEVEGFEYLMYKFIACIMIPWGSYLQGLLVGIIDFNKNITRKYFHDNGPIHLLTFFISNALFASLVRTGIRRLASRGLLFTTIAILPCIVSTALKCIMLYRVYQGGDLERIYSDWFFRSLFETSFFTFSIALLIFSNMTGSIFYAVYYFAKARKNAAVEDEPQETYISNGFPIAYEALA